MTITIEFSGPIWFWKGPSPWHFVTVPPEQSSQLHAIAGAVTYGWGMIPVKARIGATEWTTSLFPKDDLYVVPLRTDIRKAERLAAGDEIVVRLEVG